MGIASLPFQSKSSTCSTNFLSRIFHMEAGVEVSSVSVLPVRISEMELPPLPLDPSRLAFVRMP